MNNTEKLSTSDTQDTGHNKYQSKQKGQSGMNNRETLTTSHTQDKINTMYPMLSVSLCCSSCLKNFVCKLKPIIIESYTESNESLKITGLCNPIVCSGLLLKETQAYIYIHLIASGIDKIHNCPKCLKEKHFQKFR